MTVSGYDFAVIGAGPGGLEAALRAKELGLHTVLIEKKDPGGTCLNQGCIPTKALLASSRFFSRLEQSQGFGVTVENAQFDWHALVKRKNDLVEAIRNSTFHQITKAKLDWVQGTAQLAGKRKIHVTGSEPKEIEAASILIATGSAPADLPNLTLNGQTIISSTEALALTELPQSLLIVGGGAVGVEFASLFRALGVKVTLIEMLDRLLPAEDEDCAKRLETLFSRQGIRVLTGVTVAGMEKPGQHTKAHLSSGESLEVEKILLAVGRKRNTGELGLETAGVHSEKNGAIAVNDFFETNVPGIFAIGDCTSAPQLAHLASYAGCLVAENLGGHTKRVVNFSAVPSCIYSEPEVASVGLSKVREKREAGETIEVKIPFAGIAKSRIQGETDGFFKLFALKDRGIIIGACGVGAHVTELMPEVVLAVRLRLTARDLGDTLHAHPTESEILMLAARELAKKQ